MKSVGEAMSIGRTFKESLQKGLRSLEIKRFGLESVIFNPPDIKTTKVILDTIYRKLKQPNAERIFYIGDAFRARVDLEKIYDLTKIDRWFLHNIKEIIECEKQILQNRKNISKELLQKAKEYGFSDRQLGKLLSLDEKEVSDLRQSYSIMASYKLVDTCAAEFKARTPYFYSTYET
jgi:carbamoyl-phosphate synthase large subunit